MDSSTTTRIKQAVARLRRPFTRLAVPDAVRLPLQTVIAVLCAYYVMRTLGLPDVSWGAFSALFVVRASLEGTAGEACARVAGALVGIVIGVALVAADPFPWPIPWTIAIGVALMGVIAVRWPLLNYGLVTVAIITVEPGGDVLAGAWDKSLAIMVGSISGVLAALAVLPLSAGRQARFKLAESLDVLGDVLYECSATFVDCNAKPRFHARSTIEPAAEYAREMLHETRYSPLRGWAGAHGMKRVLQCVDALWRSLPILDRATGRPLSDQTCQRFGKSFSAMAEAYRDDLHRLAEDIRNPGQPAEAVHIHTALKRLEAVAGDEAALRELSEREREAVNVARWAWRMMVEATDALQAEIQRTRRTMGKPPIDARQTED